MGKLLRGANWFLVVRGSEHFPAHFHVSGADFQAMVDLRTLKIIEGEMPRAVEREVLEWAERNGERLRAEWNLWNPELAV